MFWTNGPRIKEFLSEMNRETFAKFGAVSIGEWPNTPDIMQVLEYVSAEGKLITIWSLRTITCLYEYNLPLSQNLEHGVPVRACYHRFWTRLPALGERLEVIRTEGIH